MSLKRLEDSLKASVYQRTTGQQSEEQTLRSAFRQFDADSSGEVSFDEFQRALLRFGASGVEPELLRALFDKYNVDKSESLSYDEFANGLFGDGLPASSGESVDKPQGQVYYKRGVEFSLAPGPRREFYTPSGMDARTGKQEQRGVGARAADPQPIETCANPWLPSLVGEESMDERYARPHVEKPAMRVMSLANPKHREPQRRPGDSA
jgi:hypothetical protein